jgi:hypothetical protein
MLDVPEGTRARVDPIDVDAVTAAVALRRGVAADIGEKHLATSNTVFIFTLPTPMQVLTHATCRYAFP